MTYAMRHYVESIRNARKRAYAEAYAKWIYEDGRESNQPSPPSGLSVMAAQAVRIRLDEIQRERFQLVEEATNS